MCTSNSLRRMPALRGLFAKKLHLCEKLIYSRKRELVFNLKKFFYFNFFCRETKSLKSFCLPLGWNPIYMGLKMHNSKLLKTIRGSHSHFFTHSHTHPLSPLPLVCLSLSLSFSKPITLCVYYFFFVIPWLCLSFTFQSFHYVCFKDCHRPFRLLY